MSMNKVRNYFERKNLKYELVSEDGLDSIDFEHRGLIYHIWEFEDNDEKGAEANLKSVDRMVDYCGDDFEEKIIELLTALK
ncbi:hypothetical protein SAMN05216249_104118 [Acetitomaculum ruminis DSM 5522]|uniref:Uncharacterized protein n=1 Tax=Acetitomaculum ruminis DSM 5522 TaxID=1120918 RepID=A0A1I0WKF2_9FIRM|nr:hypothetical protein [Acetitomaculum ruminis]SFA88877.1 hypothetical protein SAMN05216249_104118 [Acetitomaculum ruminis DSM 5522]